MIDEDKVFWVSLSAVQDWQRCEQRYYYSRVRKLRPIIKDVAPQRGIILHEYLGAYYQAIKDGKPAEDAHVDGRAAILTHRDECTIAAIAAFEAGQDDVAYEYQDLNDATLRIADRYWETRGRDDAQWYEPLMVESRLNIHLVQGIRSRSVVDLVLREREGGKTLLVEHKTTKSVPQSAVRLRDLQTLLYAKVIEHTDPTIRIDAVLWNYLRTKEPDKPHQNKDGRLSRAVSTDTTWPVFEKSILAAGQRVESYADMHERLAERETTVFFPRYEHVIVATPDFLLTDYAIEATRMRTAELQWKGGSSRPVRRITRDCDFCQFYRVCEAEITGGDPETAIEMKFTEGTRQ